MATLEDLETDHNEFGASNDLADSADPLVTLLRERPIASAREAAIREHRAEFPTLGIFRGFDFDDSALVTLPAALPGELVKARSTVSLQQKSIGSSVVIVCEDGDPRRPIIVGVICSNRNEARDDASDSDSSCVRVDGKRYVVTAEREIVLRCGDASITLTRAGKVIIEGKYVVSRSTGYNKIKGAVVDIN